MILLPLQARLAGELVDGIVKGAVDFVDLVSEGGGLPA